jgi:hypothetical protein
MSLDVQTIKSWFDLLFAWFGGVPAGSWLTVGASVLVAFVVYRASKRYERGKFHQTIQQMWNTVNSQALDSPEDIKVAEWLFSGERQVGDIDLGRAKYFAFMVLNPLHMAFLGKRDGVMDSEYADKNLGDLLPPIVAKDDIFPLTQGRGYHPAFSRLCARIRERELKKLAALHSQCNARPVSSSAAPKVMGAVPSVG